jgi:hypothetical protein
MPNGLLRQNLALLCWDVRRSRVEVVYREAEVGRSKISGQGVQMHRLTQALVRAKAPGLSKPEPEAFSPVIWRYFGTA